MVEAAVPLHKHTVLVPLVPHVQRRVVRSSLCLLVCSCSSSCRWGWFCFSMVRFRPAAPAVFSVAMMIITTMTITACSPPLAGTRHLSTLNSSARAGCTDTSSAMYGVCVGKCGAIACRHGPPRPWTSPQRTCSGLDDRHEYVAGGRAQGERASCSSTAPSGRRCQHDGCPGCDPAHHSL